MSEEYRKLNRRWMALTVLYVLSTLLIFIRISNIHGIDSQTTVYKTEASIPGPIGLTGMQGFQGLSGADGKPGGINTTTQLQTILVQGAKGDVGVQGQPGANGEDGQPGKTLEIRKNPDTGDIEKKYDTNDTWTVLLYHCDYDPQATECGNAN